MLLATALAHHAGALRASLMAEYRLSLHELRSMPVGEAADFVAWLPMGCAFWQDVGGPASVSMEVRELRHVSYWLRVLDFRERGSKGEKPKPHPEPEWAHERRVQKSAAQRKADAYRRRQKG